MLCGFVVRVVDRLALYQQNSPMSKKVHEYAALSEIQDKWVFSA